MTTGGDLTIVQVRQTDSGSYVCVASNGLGEPVIREVELQVTGLYISQLTAYGVGFLWHFMFSLLNFACIFSVACLLACVLN